MWVEESTGVGQQYVAVMKVGGTKRRQPAAQKTRGWDEGAAPRERVKVCWKAEERRVGSVEPSNHSEQPEDL